MAIFQTSRGRSIFHCHVGDADPCDVLRELTSAEVAAASEWLARRFPNAIELRPATFDYNCIGGAMTRSHGWFETEVEFLDDDHFEVQMDDARVGDVVIYEWKEMFAHTAVVTAVKDGEITQLISKWGARSEVLHTLTEVPYVYGKVVRIFRGNPSPFVNNPEVNEEANKAEEGENAMSEPQIRERLMQLLDPDVYSLLLLASTQKIRQEIIASLPEVQALVERGEEAALPVAEFFSRQETQANQEVSGIALYLVQKLPSEQGALAIATSLSEGKVMPVNYELAARAFVESAHLQEDEDENIVAFAFREARKFIEQH